MVFYNTEEERYFSVQMQFSNNMGEVSSQLLFFLLTDIIKELWEQKEMQIMIVDTIQGMKKIYHTTRHGEEMIVEQLLRIAEDKAYIVYKDGKQAQI